MDPLSKKPASGWLQDKNKFSSPNHQRVSSYAALEPDCSMTSSQGTGIWSTKRLNFSVVSAIRESCAIAQRDILLTDYTLVTFAFGEKKN